MKKYFSPYLEKLEMHDKQTRLALVVAMFGILLFLSIAVTLPFRDTRLAGLFPKDPTSAQEQALLEQEYSPEEQIEEGLLEPPKEIIEVSLTYTDKPSPVFTIDKIEKKNGYPGAYPSSEKPYNFQVLNSQGQSIHSVLFPAPNLAYHNDPKPNNPTSKVFVADKATLLLSIPAVTGASSIQILSPEGSVMTQKSLAGTPKRNNKQKFRSRFGDEIKEKKKKIRNKKTSQVPLVDKAHAYRFNGWLDIAFIGDDYTDFAKFHNDVNNAMAHLLTYEPFNSRGYQISVHYVDNLNDLHCRIVGSEIPIPVCNPDPSASWNDEAMIHQMVNNHGVPYDEIVVLWNTPVDGGSGGDSAVMAVGRGEWAVFAHEFGHSFGGLTDEYILGFASQPATKNCSEINPNPLWAGLTNEYFQGCNFPHWWRSSENSVMRDAWNAKYYNRVSQAILGIAMDRAAGPHTAGPSTQGSNPTPGNLSCSPATINLTTTPQAVRATFRKPDGTPNTGQDIIWRSSTPNIRLSVTRGVATTDASGVSEITATVAPNVTYAFSGTITPESVSRGDDIQSCSISVTHNPLPTPTPIRDGKNPAVTLTYPVNNDILTISQAPTVLKANASDESGIQKVEFYVNNNRACTVDTSRSGVYSCSYNFGQNRSRSNLHTIHAVAFDRTGNSTQSTSITVRTRLAPTPTPRPTFTPTPTPPPDRTPPTVRISVDGNNSRSSRVTLRANASDASGIARVEFFAGNTRICSDYSPSYSCVWDYSRGRSGSRGTHTLKAIAYDNKGNSASSSTTYTIR